MRIRLDRGIANTDWTLLFSDASVNHLCSSRSDHKDLLLRIGGDGAGCRLACSFCYEIMGDREESLGVEIAKSWLRRNPGNDLGSVAEKLRALTSDLRTWSRENFGHVTKQMETLKVEMEALEQDDPVSNLDKILEKRKELDELLYMEAIMWLQRSRISWLQEGDQNTKYFHRKVMWRARKKNRSRN